MTPRDRLMTRLGRALLPPLLALSALGMCGCDISPVPNPTAEAASYDEEGEGDYPPGMEGGEVEEGGDPLASEDQNTAAAVGGGDGDTEEVEADAEEDSEDEEGAEDEDGDAQTPEDEADTVGGDS